MKIKAVHTTLLTLGMMASMTVNLAFAATSTNQSQAAGQTIQTQEQDEQQSNGSVRIAPGVSAGIPSEQQEQGSGVTGGTSGAGVSSSSSHSGTYSSSGGSNGVTGADASDMIDHDKTYTINTHEEVNEAGIVAPEQDPNQLTYPKFSEEEMNQLFNVTHPVEETPEVPVEEGEATPEELEYLEETVQIYRHVPVNPVYTYGKDEQGKGVCAGTEEFCNKSEELWKNFEEKTENQESITHTEGEKKGQLVMPESYEQNAKNQPSVREECPSGYEPYPNGNPATGVESSHCGKLEGNVYYVKPL